MVAANRSENHFDHCLVVASNWTEDSWLSEAKFWSEVILLIILNFLVIVGNCLVLLALMIDRQLRNPTHYFICSLALADLTLGVFVLPFAAVFQVRAVWTFGSFFCQIWLAVDVWLCTASIYSLIAVTFDRYIAVTKPLTYRSVMTHRRACALIVALWTVSLIICLPAFALSLNRTYRLASTTCQCTQMAHSAVYIAYSSTGSFYLPMIVILYLYARIYSTVRRIRLSGNSGVVMTSPTEKSPRACLSIKSKHRAKREHISLLDKGRQLSAVLRVHKGGYHPARKISRQRIVERLSAGFRQGHALVSEEPMPLQSKAATGDEEAIDEAEETGASKSRLNVSAKRFLAAASCPTSSANSARSSVSAGVGASNPRRASGTPSAFGHELLVHLAMPSQLTTMWCQRIVAFQKYQKKFSLELRALRTVGIVTGCFFLSWLGFCIVYTMQALPSCRPAKSILNADFLDPTTTGYGITEHTSETTTVVVTSLSPSYSSIDSCVPDWVVNLMVWLGYLNSAINPIIYGVSNQQFRRTFRRILRCGFFNCCEAKAE